MRTNAKNALIAAIEVDKSENKEIFYYSPDFSVGVKNLELLEIAIQTKGYENLVKRSNLLVNIGFIGNLTDVVQLNINSIKME